VVSIRRRDVPVLIHHPGKSEGGEGLWIFGGDRKNGDARGESLSAMQGGNFLWRGSDAGLQKARCGDADSSHPHGDIDRPKVEAEF